MNDAAMTMTIIIATVAGLAFHTSEEKRYTSIAKNKSIAFLMYNKTGEVLRAFMFPKHPQSSTPLKIKP